MTYTDPIMGFFTKGRTQSGGGGRERKERHVGFFPSLFPTSLDPYTSRALVQLFSSQLQAARLLVAEHHPPQSEAFPSSHPALEFSLPSDHHQPRSQFLLSLFLSLSSRAFTFAVLSPLIRRGFAEAGWTQGAHRSGKRNPKGAGAGALPFRSSTRSLSLV